MTSDETQRLFTVDEANAMLPLVGAIAKDLHTLAQDLGERRARLKLLLAGRSRKAGDPYQDELTHIEQELEKDNDRLRGYIDELKELGVEPKEGGLVEFPFLMDDRIACLCWKLGEPEVLYWHEEDEGFEDRQRLTAETMAEAEE